MKWSIQYATGVKRIDEQHKGLFQMSDDFWAALDEGSGQRVYGLLLESLIAYARRHFGFEEGCMARCQCPAVQQNSRAHEKFIEALAQFQQLFDAKGFDRGDAQRLVEFVDQWLADHIGRVDVLLRPYAENL